MKMIAIAFTGALLLYANIIQAQDGDFAIDPETSQAIPKHIGEVLFVRGSVKKISGTNESALKKGGRIFRNDKVVTGARSFIKFRMIDDTLMNVGPNSQLAFNKFAYKSKTDRQVIYNFIKGQIRTHFPNKAKDGDLKILTKTTAMAVRGTKLLANVFDKGETEVTQYAVLSGKIEVDNKINKKKYELGPKDHLVVLNKGDRVSAMEDEVFKLSDDVYKKLLAIEKDEGKDETPLLDVYDKDSLKQAAIDAGMSGKEISSLEKEVEDDKPKTLTPRKKTWRKNLNELNKRLKDNQD